MSPHYSNDGIQLEQQILSIQHIFIDKSFEHLLSGVFFVDYFI